MTVSQYFIQGEGKNETVDRILKDSEKNLKMNFLYVCTLSIFANSAYQLLINLIISLFIFKLCLLTFKTMSISEDYVDHIPQIIVISASFSFLIKDINYNL